MTSEFGKSLDAAKSELRTAGGPFAPNAGEEFTNVNDLAEWLAEATRKMNAGEFVLPAMEDDAPNTLYISLNEFEINPDRWFVGAQAFLWSPEGFDDIEFSELFDSVVGHEVADVRITEFALTGMEPLQACFAEHLATAARSQNAAAEEFVVASVFHAVDRALALAGDLGVRIALSRSDEERIALWQYVSEGWSGEVQGDAFRTE
jgi:hypothetical protein